MAEYYLEKFIDAVAYDPSSPSGLVWKIGRGKSRKGKPCGSIKGNGYYQVGLYGKYYPCHRIVWYLSFGEIPDGCVIDHINNNPLDNRIENLRIATQQQNTRNRRKRVGVSSRFKGVSWNSKAKKWKVGIMVNGKVKHFGYFNSEEEAASVAKNAYDQVFGEFAWENINGQE